MISRGNMGRQIATAPASRKASSGEGSAKDMREDKAMAKSRGMSLSEWEKSGADAKHDSKKMAKGGKVRGDGVAIRGKTKGTSR